MQALGIGQLEFPRDALAAVPDAVGPAAASSCALEWRNATVALDPPEVAQHAGSKEDLQVHPHRGHHAIRHDTHEGHWQDCGRYDTWHAENFAYFVKRLHELEDEGGRILDQTLVLYGSCCSTTHNARKYPLALVGGRKLGLKHGQYLRFDEATPLSNLFVSMLAAVGVETESFADSKGALEGLCD